MKNLLPILLLLLPISVSAGTVPIGDFKLDAAHSSIVYKLIHPFHKVTGMTKSIEGRVVTKAEGGDVMIRIKADTFDSGNANRDVHAKEVLETHKFPYIVFRGKIRAGSSEGNVHADGTLEFHGVTKPMSLDLPVKPHDLGLTTQISFPISLDAYSVERPSLVSFKVDDTIQISGELVFHQTGGSQ